MRRLEMPVYRLPVEILPETFQIVLRFGQALIGGLLVK
jgi:hypothetical protein